MTALTRRGGREEEVMAASAQVLSITGSRSLWKNDKPASIANNTDCDVGGGDGGGDGDGGGPDLLVCFELPSQRKASPSRSISNMLRKVFGIGSDDQKDLCDSLTS